MRKIKAGKRGEVVKYVSRAKAIKKLQLSLKDFRRLCILKGVYPREPPKKLKKTSRTYYHLKDINFLALDPIIEKLRSQNVYLKKFKKAKAKDAKLTKLEERWREALTEAREARDKADALENAAFDLKAVTPNRPDTTDKRTPAELMAFIGAKGKDADAALAKLAELMQVTG
jgi:hypothetical protein